MIFGDDPLGRADLTRQRLASPDVSEIRAWAVRLYATGSTREKG